MKSMKLENFKLKKRNKKMLRDNKAKFMAKILKRREEKKIISGVLFHVIQ